MNKFEMWWFDLSNQIALKMSIFLTVYDMEKFQKYYDQGLSVQDAIMKHYTGV